MCPEGRRGKGEREKKRETSPFMPCVERKEEGKLKIRNRSRKIPRIYPFKENYMAGMSVS